MSAQHTPGPWEASFSEMGGYDSMTGAWEISSGVRTIATVDQRDYGQKLCVDFLSPEAEANARLIAAAPELLEALEAVVAISDRKHDAWDRAHAIIAKAKGE